MAWIEVHQALLTHRKTMALAEVLGVCELYAASHMISLWLWALDNAPDARLPKSVHVIAKAAQWAGDPDEFTRAALQVAFIEQDEGGYFIHDWHDYAGRLIDERRANAERQRAFRERRRNGYVTVTGNEALPSRNGATVHNPTQHNPREPIERERGAPAPAQEVSLSFEVDWDSPKQWKVTDEWWEWAKGEGWLGTRQMLQSVVDNWRDDRRAKGLRPRDPKADLRKWIRGEIRDYQSAPHGARGGALSGGRTGNNGRAIGERVAPVAEPEPRVVVVPGVAPYKPERKAS